MTFRWGLVAIIAVGFLTSACATKNSTQKVGRLTILDEEANPILLPEELEAREKEGVQFDIPIVRNAKVEQWLAYFQGRGAKWYRVWLERSGRYIPMMRKILRDHDMPEDLVYLAMIESGFSSRAFSRARAVGPWQFMKATGRLYNLRADFWVDERRDPEKASIAAARHLKDLYDQFQSWKLAAAAYNAGAGKVSRAIRKYRTEDFWELSKGRYLRPETRHYVPKLIAAALIAKEPEKYGFKDIQYQEPLAYEKIVLTSQVDLNVLARQAGRNVDELLDLNPELNRSITPPVAQYELRVPSKSSENYMVAFNSLGESDRFRAIVHRVKKGDTLGGIARAYGVSGSEILATNQLKSGKRLKVGSELVLPISQSANNRRNVDRAAERTAENNKVVAREVRKVARAAKVEKQQPRIEVANASAGNDTVHVVRRGENLWSIAQRYGVTVRRIKNENNLRRNNVRPGLKLVIPVS